MSSSKAQFNTTRAVRRQFIHPVGSSSSRLAGWLEMPYVLSAIPVGPDAPEQSDVARLAEGILLQPTRSGANLYREDRRNRGPVGQVNPTVRYVLEHLDGRQAIPELADGLARAVGLSPMEHESHCLAIAKCLNSLSAGQLLAEPFSLAAWCRKIRL
jgi:hypothetical protein